MGMDVDNIVARDYLGKIEKILFDMPHGEREEICDDIIEFYEQMKKKYGDRR